MAREHLDVVELHGRPTISAILAVCHSIAARAFAVVIPPNRTMVSLFAACLTMVEVEQLACRLKNACNLLDAAT
jgi:hypothetical protein